MSLLLRLCVSLKELRQGFHAAVFHAKINAPTRLFIYIFFSLPSPLFMSRTHFTPNVIIIIIVVVIVDVATIFSVPHRCALLCC
ncbi:hypothetical protein, unlikely [Trypanosoma brucei gambiense DAL972]|uniref:Uncharacterized protein n=1 Tax=Trypanosoma brucei gambiense (strain MHOM/CI/86/DAL972) TaxID=679716 RepID=C9ZII9_TRYB9|nr:hypothetical protein, unlikely [Trypanosoma brucei gambiense DAL972]CBH08981.1 hypothetical protein, unlikely [Trypanosoma brucei gambiense DAL972]|eukprot:XP_011771422.1 hypothetical protein, unlikely [Trypanosoma brucei gambiense DAL972]